MVLVLDTSAETAFIGLWDKKWVSKESFVAGRDLNSLIIKKLDDLFSYSAENQNMSSSFSGLSGIIVNAGPGSFTGLRIGLSVANTMAYTLDIPIVGVVNESDPEKLLQKGQKMVESRGASFGEVVVPHYGAEPHITKPKPKG